MQSDVRDRRLQYRFLKNQIRKHMSQTVEQALIVQRKKTSFSIERMREFLYGSQYLRAFEQWMNNQPSIPYDFNIHNEGRVALIKQAYRILASVINNPRVIREPTETSYLYLMMETTLQMPGTVHLGMFIKCIEFMGTQTQKQEYLQKCKNLEIIGCYAQTELGHGSDVQSLQTTATYVLEEDQFIINTPTVTATKFWPGEMGINANYALVFAQMIVKQKNYGVQSFLVRIRDEDHNPMPGISVGDIGPKIGFHSKDNGYLSFNNVRIPKRNMLRKFISVSKKGQIKKKGNPTISYATMMTIRMYISCAYPKIYSQAIAIGTRYSMFRRQFQDKTGTQIKIIDYQLQQQKITPRIAEFYAITIGGNYIRNLCQQNFKKVSEKQDFSLMAETHACLSCTKAFYSETVFNGIDVIRRACGGHGFSYYSGLPSLYYQYAANVTHQGQNTVLYLQTARYLLKSYKHSVTKKKPLGDSVKYIDSYDFLMGRKCEVDPSDFSKWNLEDIRILLAQSVCHLISVITSKIMGKEEGQSDLDVLNYGTGIRLQQLSIAHVAYFTYNCFRQAVQLEKDQAARDVLISLCTLYGINQLLANAGHIIEGRFITPQQITSVKQAKESMLKKLRPHLIGLVDSFALRESFIKSELVRGNPYENFYRKAKENSLNRGIQEAAVIVKDGIQEALKPKL